MTEDLRTIAGYALREALRRRVLSVVVILTLCFLGLYWLGVREAFDEVQSLGGVPDLEEETLVGATLIGLAMFVTLFLGVVLAIFLTLGAVRGDAERGLLQPVLVRSVSRAEMLGGRLAAAAAVCSLYVLALYFAAMLITGAIGGWWPDHALVPGLALALGVVLVAALSLGGSVVFASTANGIATFMVFGAGLVAGLLGQIGEALGSGTLEDIATFAAWALPFEALYQHGLSALTSDTVGITRFVIELGPLGGAEPAGASLWVWAVAYLGLVVATALAAFKRADL